jgi:hypothetical protein
MTVREAERLAALWCAGQPLDDLPQWRTAMQVLARELADTRAALKKANDQAERFERGWYLRGDALERIERWHGEFPATGRYWDEPENTRPMSYSACYGSNGERDFMRQVAREALKA